MDLGLKENQSMLAASLDWLSASPSRLSMEELEACGEPCGESE